jgi:cobalt/nickel transport system permease protein
VHIPDGYLGPQTYAVIDVAILPVWAAAASRVRRTLKSRQVPLMALGAAFSFVLMMFNVPVFGGTTAHAVGAVLIAVLLGPWAACLSVSTAIVIQALAFGDGGITSIGANCLNMAVVMPFVGFAIYRLVSGPAPSLRRKIAASGAGAYLGLVAASIAAGIEFGLQPLLAHDAAGHALYAPYSLAVAVPSMAVTHLVVGLLEAAVTMGVVAALAKSDPALVAMRPASRPLTWLWAGLGALILLTPLGLLASGSAWGEWAPAAVKGMVGYVPAGLQRMSGVWTAAMPDYAPAFIKDPVVGYVAAALTGAALIVAIVWLVGIALSRRDDGAPVPTEDEEPS